MNAERLNALATTLRSEIVSDQVDESLTALVEALETVINNPDPTYQQTLANAIQQIYTTLAEATSENFSPAWKQMLDEIGGDSFAGPQLMKTIQGIFERNQITPAVGLKELKALQKRFKRFLGALDNLEASFEVLEIGSDQLEPGECEMGIVIPRQEIHNRLPDLATELSELTFITETFSEIATGKPDELEIKTLSSSDLMVILKASVNVCAVFAKAVEKVTGLYKSLLELKKMKQEMTQRGLPESLVSGLEEHANQQMSAGIEQISIEVVKENYSIDDEGRQNELITRTKISLTKIADRIDRGFSIEVRAAPLTAGQEAKDDTAVKIQVIQKAAKNIHFIKPGGPPLLRLEDTKSKPQKHTTARAAQSSNEQSGTQPK